jgi:hypothetical protein
MWVLLVWPKLGPRAGLHIPSPPLKAHTSRTRMLAPNDYFVCLRSGGSKFVHGVAIGALLRSGRGRHRYPPLRQICRCSGLSLLLNSVHSILLTIPGGWSGRWSIAAAGRWWTGVRPMGVSPTLTFALRGPATRESAYLPTDKEQ